MEKDKIVFLGIVLVLIGLGFAIQAFVTVEPWPGIVIYAISASIGISLIALKRELI